MQRGGKNGRVMIDKWRKCAVYFCVTSRIASGCEVEPLLQQAVRKACDIDTHLGTVLAKSYVSAGYQWNVRLHVVRYPPQSGTYYPPGIIQVRLGTRLSWQIVHMQVETTVISQRQTAKNIHAAANSCTIQRITG